MVVTAVTQPGYLGRDCSQRAIALSACIRYPFSLSKPLNTFLRQPLPGAIATVGSIKMG
ncbi:MULTISPECIES: hypothetical protein [Cyanophyceae]|nr:MULTISPECIES: hypothetical protein [Cyanophyceae]